MSIHECRKGVLIWCLLFYVIWSDIANHMRQLLILYLLLINDGYMTSLVLKNVHQKDMCHNKIGLCPQNLYTILSSKILNTIGRAHVILTWKRIFSLNSNTFCISLQFWNLNWESLWSKFQRYCQWDESIPEPIQWSEMPGVKRAHSKTANLRQP